MLNSAYIAHYNGETDLPRLLFIGGVQFQGELQGRHEQGPD